MKTRDERNREVERRRTAWQEVKAIQWIDEETRPSWAFYGCRWCQGKGRLTCDSERERAKRDA